MAKQRFGTKMDAQVRQLESMFTVIEMDRQGVQAALAQLVSSCTWKETEQLKDWEHRVLKNLFKFDLGMLNVSI